MTEDEHIAVDATIDPNAGTGIHDSIITHKLKHLEDELLLAFHHIEDDAKRVLEWLASKV